MTTPHHDIAHVAGVSEACKFNDHGQCRASGCGCDCHAGKVAASLAPIIEQRATAAPAGKEKACPSCGARRPSYERYCRIDGTALSSLLCLSCGSVTDPADVHCWGCGFPLKGRGVAGAAGGDAQHMDADADSADHNRGTEAEDLDGLAELQELWARKQAGAGDDSQLPKPVTELPGEPVGVVKVPKPKVRVPFKPPS